MIPRKLLPPLALLAVVAGATACPGGGGGDDDDDDDDSGSNTPEPYDVCQIVWAQDDASAPAFFDFFIVDAERADWVSGPGQYSVNDPIGVLYNEKAYPSMMNPNPVAASAAITTAGDFQLTLGNGLATGGTVEFTDPTDQVMLSLDPVSGTIGGVVGTGFDFTFEGVWSDPDPEAPLTNGDGVAQVTYLGSSLTLGLSPGSYAVCYQSTTAATAAERSRLTIERVLRHIENTRGITGAQ